MAYVNHVNYPDADGEVYCRLRDKIVNIVEDNHVENYCNNCVFFAGSSQGEGVECRWDDPREDVSDPHVVRDPRKELSQLSVYDLTASKEKLIVEK